MRDDPPALASPTRYRPRGGRLPALAAAGAGLAATVISGCGFHVSSADLFVLQRSGQGPRLNLLVNDGGTVRCNRGSPRPLPDPLLLRARDIAGDLDKDVKGRLHLPPRPGSVYRFTVKLQDGSITFSDLDGARHPELARAEQFALDAAHGPCGL